MQIHDYIASHSCKTKLDQVSPQPPPTSSSHLNAFTIKCDSLENDYNPNQNNPKDVKFGNDDEDDQPNIKKENSTNSTNFQNENLNQKVSSRIQDDNVDVNVNINDDDDDDIASNTNNNSKFCCLSRELWTCLALSSIVIGLPIAIMIMLINLPRLSSQRDTRQQNYILLAFGLPFSCVMIVAVLYFVYSLTQRIRKGPNHSRWFSPNHLHHHHHHHHHYNQNHRQHGHHHKKKFNEDSLTTIDEDDTTTSAEPKLYSLVTQVMSNHHQQQRLSQANISTNID